jgi:hypothetical protein
MKSQTLVLGLCLAVALLATGCSCSKPCCRTGPTVSGFAPAAPCGDPCCQQGVPGAAVAVPAHAPTGY